MGVNCGRALELIQPLCMGSTILGSITCALYYIPVRSNVFICGPTNGPGIQVKPTRRNLSATALVRIPESA